jgi:hypothetical protein
MKKFINWVCLLSKWTLLLVVNLVTNLFSFPLAPIVVLFADEKGWLPKWLWWFQTPDNSLDGDSDWQFLYRPYAFETNDFRRWVNRWRWLWRNRLCGLSLSVLGVKYEYTTDRIDYVGDLNIGNGYGAKSGWFFKTISRKGWIRAFQFYYVRQYKSRPQSCVRILVGWKCPRPGAISQVCSFGFSPSPLMHYNS